MLEFRASSGNAYAWCGDVGLVVPISPAMRAIIRETATQEQQSKEDILGRLAGEFDAEDLKFCYDWICKWKKIPQDRTNIESGEAISISNIRSFLLKHGLSQLILNITDDCNFRCKYCAYSDYYKFTRNYSKKTMSFATARKAIDLYASLIEEGRRYNPHREPSLGFFGGEPLLHFDLIKKCVEYVEKRYGRWHYQITTNGSLLDEKKGSWLKSYSFFILISLDGPEDEHDRNRVYHNGRGTFKAIMDNVKPFLEEQYSDIGSIAVVNPRSNLFKIEDFFKGNDVPQINRAVSVSRAGGCTYYEQFNKDDLRFAKDQLDSARAHYIGEIRGRRGKDKRNTFFDALFYAHLEHLFFAPELLRNKNPLSPYTGTCIPGFKIFVDVDGKLHACEKIVESIPIGTAAEGLDYEKISEILKEYLRHMDKCPTCEVEKLCLRCMVDLYDDADFSCSSKICEKVESNTLESLSEALSIAEREPKMIDDMDRNDELLMKWRED